MLSHAGRPLLKRVLAVARVKLLYGRITLTWFTTFYFFFSLITCVILCALQGVTFVDNSVAVSALSPYIKNVSMDSVTILTGQNLQTCTSIPNQRGTICTVKLQFHGHLSQRDVSESLIRIRHETLDVEDTDDDENDGDSFADIKYGIPSSTAIAPLLDDNCIISLAWFGELIEDGKRDEVVTFLFQIWLFALAVVAILNESIPHLGAAFLGHALGTGWAGYRTWSTHYLRDLYRNVIVPQACGQIDVLGYWWDIRLQHSIPILIVDAVTLVAFVYPSAKLYKVYASESFSRVGASPMIHRIYKIVLSFSVCLQLSGFFSLASIAMWITKFCYGSMKTMALHADLYLAAFIVILVLQFPGLYLGWICVRRECKIRFAVFCVISIFPLGFSTAMFFSPLYQFILTTSPFFATVTVTAYILMIATGILSVICRLNFGKGLAHYLQVTDALEGLDFTPVSFSKGDDSDAEKNNFEELKGSTRAPMAPIALQLPTLSFQDREKRPKGGSSIHFESNGNPLVLSSSRPLVSELGPPPRRSRWSKAPSQRRSAYATSLRGSTYNPQSKVESNSRAVQPMPTIKPSSNESTDILSSPPLRSSSQSSSALRNGLPANPRAGKQRGN